MHTLRTIRETVDEAIAAGTSLRVDYMDRNGAVTHGRIVTPKGYIGRLDQTVRTYDEGEGEFRSLTIERILDAALYTDESPASAAFVASSEPAGTIEKAFSGLGPVTVEVAGDTVTVAYQRGAATVKVSAPTLAAAAAAIVA